MDLNKEPNSRVAVNWKRTNWDEGDPATLKTYHQRPEDERNVRLIFIIIGSWRQPYGGIGYERIIRFVLGHLSSQVLFMLVHVMYTFFSYGLCAHGSWWWWWWCIITSSSVMSVQQSWSVFFYN